ncbi:MAG: phosphodiester glycosidase family protein [Chitinophagaceae bacterium]|nr:MAG: phosphodiester glycosidase family protein [Chitinophagaceae bacterium]
MAALQYCGAVCFFKIILRKTSGMHFHKIFFKIALLCVVSCVNIETQAQTKWKDAGADFGPLPDGFNVFSSTDSLDGKPFRAFYAIADIGNKNLNFATDTTHKRRLSPSKFYEKNDNPLLVANTTFFSFGTNQNLNLVIKEGKMVGFNIHSLSGKGKDTLTYRHAFNGAIGISKKRKADVAWIYSDSSFKYALAAQTVPAFYKDSINIINKKTVLNKYRGTDFRLWKMQTAVAGGPVLLQNGDIKISNNEEQKFNGKAINDKHPRTLMGYTKDNKLIVMVVEGRNPGVADGVTLVQSAQLLKELGCVEGLNLDGGGSSCMLINGKETIRPSDKTQRPVPAVFIISRN